MRIGAFELNEPVPELRDPHAFAMVRPWVDVGSVGTLTLNRLERYLLGSCNFNFHAEHHLHPGVPACHLERLHRYPRELVVVS